MSPSGSVAVALQVSKVVVVTELLGEMLPETDQLGLLFMTRSESDEVAVAPSLSVMVAVQVMKASGSELAAVNVRVLPVPTVLPLGSLHT